MPAVLWIAIGSSVAGAVFLLAGGLLIVGAIRARRTGSPATVSGDDEGRIDAER
jgi:hypothetical protein